MDIVTAEAVRTTTLAKRVFIGIICSFLYGGLQLIEVVVFSAHRGDGGDYHRKKT